MDTFVVPDLHGRPGSLRLLLRKAGIIDGDNKRTDFGQGILLASIGDLFNATLSDVGGDEETFRMIDLFDILILGNHESPYLGLSAFSGYYDHPPLRTAYNGLYRRGLIHPCWRIGDTLLTHAGVNKNFDFQTAEEAEARIRYLWQEDRHDPLIDGIGQARGGRAAMGGILWSDWHEPKNEHFSQVLGHTPISSGPCIRAWDEEGIFHVNIDCGGKKGLPPVGLWLDKEGQIIEFVRPGDFPG